MLLATLLAGAQALAATAQGVPPPILEAVFGGTPENFAVTNVHTDWQWHEDVVAMGPLATARIELDLRLPPHWTAGEMKSELVKLVSLKRVSADAKSHDGLWRLVAEQSTALGTAQLEFATEPGHVQTLSLALRSKSLHPYVLIRKQCPEYDVALDPQVEKGRYFYLIVNCVQFADEVTLYFARSPDARWIASDIVKNPKPLSFEYSVPKKTDHTKRHLFDLRTEDTKGQRTEYEVSVSEKP